MKAILLGDAMIPAQGFEGAWKKHLNAFGDDIVVVNWEEDWSKLQNRRLEVEKHGPEIEPIDEIIVTEGGDADVLLGLFFPVSSKVMDAMPGLRIIGVSRAGLENVNVAEATKRGILVFNVEGRNAHAVSDFTVGMMLSECRNIARAHHAIKSGVWRKIFVNSDAIPELNGKTVGLVGFGYIGKLVAKKLSGFDVNLLVFDPYAREADVLEHNGKKVELDNLLQRSDFISLHARLSDSNRKMISEREFSLMKKSAYFINTGRAGLVDESALVNALKQNNIMGAALDVFTTEPIEPGHDLLALDNVTLTTHIAGTTADALNNSPYLLTEDIAKFLGDNDARFIVNPDVLEHEAFKTWLEEVRHEL